MNIEANEIMGQSSVVRSVVLLCALLGAWLPHSAQAQKYTPPVSEFEDYKNVPMPSGFGVQYTDVDGPVFVDSEGLTLYIWPLVSHRNGDTGELPGKPTCGDEKHIASAGYMTPYPGGPLLPDLDKLPACTDVWLPVYANEGAPVPVGDFSIVTRSDGKKQWAYEGYPLYKSVLDKKPGQVNGGSSRARKYDSPNMRRPIGPPSKVPPAFAVRMHAKGRLLTTKASFSVYSSDNDEPNKSKCYGSCLENWTPVQAGEFEKPQGEWGIIERALGVKQWTFRGKPLYTHPTDRRFRSLEGSDVDGWHNVFVQKNVAPPQEFTVQDARIGQVLADRNGHSLYVYNCGEDSLDQLACDHPTTTQVYRLAVCGNGDPLLCNKTWPYALAPLDAKTDNLIWGTAWIDPSTGVWADAETPNAVHVWTFRDRPIYTFGGDKAPGDTNGDAWGEWWGNRNGFKAMWLRDDFTSAGPSGGNAD